VYYFYSSSPLKIKNKSKNSTPKSNKRAQFSKEKPDLIINKKVKVSTPKSKKQVLMAPAAKYFNTASNER
jgi:hypothetical protein